ncbi:hypothetical protein KI387_003206, partial [Taxus chinensis]
MKAENGFNDDNNYNHFLAVKKMSSKLGKGNKRSNGNNITKTPVYTIHKSEFRNTVQMLTGLHSPSNNGKQVSNEPSQLRQIRPPRLAGLDLLEPQFGRASNPGPTNANSLTPISMQFPFPSALDAFWANLAVNQQQQTQYLHPPTAPSIWVETVPSVDINSLPAFPSPGSR